MTQDAQIDQTELHKRPWPITALAIMFFLAAAVFVFAGFHGYQHSSNEALADGNYEAYQRIERHKVTNLTVFVLFTTIPLALIGLALIKGRALGWWVNTLAAANVAGASAVLGLPSHDHYWVIFGGVAITVSLALIIGFFNSRVLLFFRMNPEKRKQRAAGLLGITAVIWALIFYLR